MQHPWGLIRCPPVTRKVPCRQEDTIHGFCWSGKKAFNHVFRRVIWWDLHKLDIDEWLVRFIARIYGYARSRMCVGCNLSSVRKLAFTKANAWVPWCSSWFWKPSPRVLYRMSLRIPAYRKPGNHFWISGITARKADYLEEHEHGRQETSDQHGQNHGPDNWTRTRFHHKILCRMRQIQWSPVHPHLLLISYHLQRKSIRFVPQEYHAKPSPTSFDLQRLQHNNWALIHWMCGVFTKGQFRLQDL